jgi:hypothetical protein
MLTKQVALSTTETALLPLPSLSVTYRKVTNIILQPLNNYSRPLNPAHLPILSTNSRDYLHLSPYSPDILHLTTHPRTNPHPPNHTSSHPSTMPLPSPSTISLASSISPLHLVPSALHRTAPRPTSPIYPFHTLLHTSSPRLSSPQTTPFPNKPIKPHETTHK